MGTKLTKTGEPRKIKAGSGRRNGAFSFVLIPLDELNKKFADQTTHITVGRLWAEQVGFKDLVAKQADKLHDEIQGETPQTKVTATVKNFDE